MQVTYQIQPLQPPIAPPLKGAVLTGTPEDITRKLQNIESPVLAELVPAELERLHHVLPELTGDGKGINIIQAFADTIGVPADKLENHMLKHSTFRSHTYLSDPYIIRDLFDGARNMADDGGRVAGQSQGKLPLHFQPTTSWQKAGDAVFRFCIMLSPISAAQTTGRRPQRQLRTPVVMIDGPLMDVMERHGPDQRVLGGIKSITDAICHDYIHTSFLYYPASNAPDGVETWNKDLLRGKEVWRPNTLFNYNYEVLATLGHRQVMEKVYERKPEVKERLIHKVEEFSKDVDKLCASIRAGEPDGEKLAQRMEKYLMTNYMRFAYHILSPEEPALGWVKERYPTIAEDLNLTNGKGLVSILHAHQGVPAEGMGEADRTFKEWLSSYIAAHEQVLSKEKNFAAKRHLPTTGTGLGAY